MLIGCTRTTRRCGLHRCGPHGSELLGSAHRGTDTSRVLAGHVLPCYRGAGRAGCQGRRWLTCNSGPRDRGNILGCYRSPYWDGAHCYPVRSWTITSITDFACCDAGHVTISVPAPPGGVQGYCNTDRRLWQASGVSCVPFHCGVGHKKVPMHAHSGHTNLLPHRIQGALLWRALYHEIVAWNEGGTCSASRGSAWGSAWGSATATSPRHSAGKPARQFYLRHGQQLPSAHVSC